MNKTFETALQQANKVRSELLFGVKELMTDAEREEFMAYVDLVFDRTLKKFSKDTISMQR